MNTLPTIHQLRRQGLKIRVSHQRLYYFFDARTGVKKTLIAHPEEISKEDCWFLSHLGGRTVITIIDKENIEYVGESECSRHDRYTKRKGAKKALARAYACYYEVNQNFN